jgi:hypothetical protein
MSLDLIVDGKCSSSCANYLVPVARTISTTKGSVILVHGSAQRLRVGAKEQFVEELRSKHGLDPATAEQVAQDTIAGERNAYSLQRRFATEFAVGAGYFAPELLPATARVQNGPNEFVVVSPAVIRACLPKAVLGSFWYPQRDDELQTVVAARPKTTLLWVGELGENHACTRSAADDAR